MSGSPSVPRSPDCRRCGGLWCAVSGSGWLWVEVWRRWRGASFHLSPLIIAEVWRCRSLSVAVGAYLFRVYSLPWWRSGGVWVSTRYRGAVWVLLGLHLFPFHPCRGVGWCLARSWRRWRGASFRFRGGGVRLSSVPRSGGVVSRLGRGGSPSGLVGVSLIRCHWWRWRGSGGLALPLPSLPRSPNCRRSGGLAVAIALVPANLQVHPSLIGLIPLYIFASSLNPYALKSLKL